MINLWMRKVPVVQIHHSAVKMKGLQMLICITRTNTKYNDKEEDEFIIKEACNTYHTCFNNIML